MSIVPMQRNLTRSAANDVASPNLIKFGMVVVDGLTNKPVRNVLILQKHSIQRLYEKPVAHQIIRKPFVWLN